MQKTMWVLLFTFGVAATSESPHDTTTINGIVPALQTIFDNELDAKTRAVALGSTSRRDSMEKREIRIARAVAYSSNLNPYDLGPIGQCSFPVLDSCKFLINYTVPEVIARQAPELNDQFHILSNRILKVEGSSCERSLMDFLCRRYMTPQCVSNTTVRFPSANAQEHCRQAVLSCPRTASTLRRTVCNQLDTSDISGDYSLIRCRIPSIESCNSSRLVPEWIAAKQERTVRQNPLDQTVASLRLYGSCRNNFQRLACTLPTCESNGRMQGYRSEATCNSFLSCISDSSTRASFSNHLNCDSIYLLRRPSKCAGRDGRCSRQPIASNCAEQFGPCSTPRSGGRRSSMTAYIEVAAVAIGIILLLITTG